MQSNPLGPKVGSAWSTSSPASAADGRGAAGLRRAGSAAATTASLAGSASNALTDFQEDGGHVSLWMTSTGAAAAGGLARLGFALADDGTPNFDQIVAAGGKVTGALPPLGEAKQVFNVDGRITTLYAAEVDRGDGSPPVFVKGADLRADRTSATAGRRDQILAATRFLQQPPNSLSEARALCPDGLRTWPSPVTRSVDIYT